MNTRTDISRLIASLTKRAVELFAPDELEEGLLARIKDHVSLTAYEAEKVQCVGMTDPIPLLDLYQPTRLKQNGASTQDIRSAREAAIIYAGPGQGKTTLLKYILLSGVDKHSDALLFFSLRTEGHTDLLCNLVDVLDSRRKFHRIPPRCEPILLLVDGYDEISEAQQKVVTTALFKFSQSRAGRFMLTCRSGYTVRNLKCNQHELAEFERADAVRYVDAYAQAFGIRGGLNGEILIGELEQRKLSYIASHPLMLTLACVIKSRTAPNLPHNSIELLRQAVETLDFRWDEARGIQRPKERLLSIHMIECTMLIAYEMTGLRVAKSQVLEIIGKYLKLLHRSGVGPEVVLDDIRKFFGLIVTTPDGYCQFVHSTIHDYLAARYMVENGRFEPGTIRKWDLRAAYAASLQHDASFSLHTAFVQSASIEAVRECLINGARFDVEGVANAVFLHFRAFHDFKDIQASPARVMLSCSSDFFDVADDAFLDAIARKALSYQNTNYVRVVLGFCLSEYRKRRLQFPAAVLPSLSNIFGSSTVELAVWRFGNLEEFKLSSVIETDLSASPDVQARS
jgi:hypothetical protein